MIHQIRGIGITFLVFLGVNFLGAAQNFKFNTRQRGVDLPVQNVLKVAQDSLGRMWFATVRGVFYSDGIATYPLPDSLTAEFDYRISIHIDEDGIIWLFNQNGLPKIFKGGYGKWEEVVLPLDFGTKESNRIALFSTGKGEEKQLVLESGELLVTWRSGINELVSLPRSDYQDAGRLFSVSKIEGKLYYFFENSTLSYSNGQFLPVSFKGIRLSSPPLIVKYSDFSKEYYFLGKDFLVKGAEFERPEVVIDAGSSIVDFNAQSYAGLFFKDDNVFYHVNSQLKKYASYNRVPLAIDLQEVLNSFFITHSIIDREGVLWIATSRGVINFTNLKFQNYSKSSFGLMSEEVTAILDLGQGEFLFGFNNGIQKYAKQEVSTVYRDPFVEGAPQNRIINFSQDPESGEVWFSSNLAGVGKYYPKTGKTLRYLPPTPLNISSVVVEGDSVLITGSRSVFIAHKSASGQELYQRNLISEIQELINQPIFFLRKAAKLKDGRIVITAGKKYTDQPLVLENDRFVVVQGFDVLETDQGLLIGSDDGLKIYQDGKATDYILGGQRIENPVYCFLRDSQDKIWMGTDFGVVKLTEEGFIRFDERNGLVGNEVNRGALIESESGRILIGTLKGFSIFFPEEKFQAKGTPKIYLSSYKLGNVTSKGLEKLSVSYSENSFQAEFIAPGFIESKEVWIHYRLLGFDNDEWQIIRDPRSNQLFFNNLPAGDYQLELKASYNGMDFSKTVFSEVFTIQKPFYFQFWFLFLACMFLVGVGILISVLYRQLRKLGLLKAAFDTKEKEKISAEQQFKNVWDSSKDALILVLDSEQIVTANPAFGKLTGEDPDFLRGKTMRQLFTRSDFCEKDLRFNDPETKINLVQGISLETVFPWSTGPLEMQLFAKLIQQDYQGKNLILCVFRDISAEKAIENNLREAKEKAEEANRFKSSLLSNISHEIRTPLNGILGGAEHIIMSRAQDQALTAQLDIILQSGERLLGTINSILDMAKIEANKMEICYEDVEFVQYFKTIMMPLKTLANRKHIEVVEVYRKPVIFGKTDKRFLEMILNNLVSNSIKYTDEGQITLTIDQQGSSLVLEIVDTGIGMSPDYFKKIFQPFEQESSGNTRLYDGTGLGLSITKNLIELLGGLIVIESEKNTGTVVKLEIPV